MGGPPSAWIETTALGCRALAIAARSSTQGPTWSSLPRDMAVRTPSWSSSARISSTVSQLKVCSGKPSAVLVPVVWQSLVPPRPVGTWRVIEASLAPLCPGSRKTIMPATLPGTAWASGAGSEDADEHEAGGRSGHDTQPSELQHGRHGKPSASRLESQQPSKWQVQRTRDHNVRRPSCNPVTPAIWELSDCRFPRNSPSCRRRLLAGLQQLQAALIQAHEMQHKLMEAQQQIAETEVAGQAGGGLVVVSLNGSGEVLGIRIDPQVVDPNDVETLQDLIVAALHNAADTMREAVKEVLGPLAAAAGQPMPE